jgi:transcriptional regulator with XRE-family HTH domain
MATFGQKLRILRMVRGFTQLDMAVKVGMQTSQVSLIENDLLQPTDRQMAAFREVLNWPKYADAAYAILFGDQDDEGQAEAAS